MLVVILDNSINDEFNVTCWGCWGQVPWRLEWWQYGRSQQQRPMEGLLVAVAV